MCNYYQNFYYNVLYVETKCNKRGVFLHLQKDNNNIILIFLCVRAKKSNRLFVRDYNACKFKNVN